jgi:hypothetical protein
MLGTQTDLNALKALPFVEKLILQIKPWINQPKVLRLKRKKRFKTAKTNIDYAYGFSSNQIQMLTGLLHQQNYTGSGKIIGGGFWFLSRS